VGAAMVEMAIVLPVLVLLVFGIIDFGRLYNTQVTLTHAAREGIRDYAIFQDPVQAENVARQAVTSFDPTPMVFGPLSCDPGQPATMTIAYPFNSSIPFLGEEILTIRAEGVMRCGG
jgi:Flp pilus assembly protein TadG